MKGSLYTPQERGAINRSEERMASEVAYMY